MRRRAFPLIASVGLIVVGMYTTTWGPAMLGRTEWALPYDLWGTLIATTRLAHGNIGGIYAPPTGLISLPGAAVILVPCAALISALGLSLDIPGPHNLHPGVWLVAGPYQIALCCVTLFAADALARRLGAEFWKRGLLAVASASILWSVSARWGHPEDAVAVGLLLYAILAQSQARPGLAGWLTGAAVCVQPLVLLALPVMLAVLPWRRMVPFLVRAALPSVLLLGAVALANWHDTYRSVTSQPNSPVINHPTAWTSLAPQMAGQNVAAGPFRLATILLACLCALAVRRHWQSRMSPAGTARPDDRNERNERNGMAGRRPVAGRAARQRALVGRADAGAPLVLRAGHGLVLPVAADGRRADHRRHAELAAPARGGHPGRRPHRGGPGPVARGLDLVGADRRGPGRPAGGQLAQGRRPRRAGPVVT